MLQGRCVAAHGRKQQSPVERWKALEAAALKSSVSQAQVWKVMCRGTFLQALEGRGSRNPAAAGEAGGPGGPPGSPENSMSVLNVWGFGVILFKELVLPVVKA